MSEQKANMTRDDLTKLHSDLSSAAAHLMKAKNHDYAHSDDIFRNFRMFGSFGILVRLSDKIARLRSFEDSGQFAVQDERLDDTIVDIINYAVLYRAMRLGAAPCALKT